MKKLLLIPTLTLSGCNGQEPFGYLGLIFMALILIGAIIKARQIRLDKKREGYDLKHWQDEARRKHAEKEDDK